MIEISGDGGCSRLCEALGVELDQEFDFRGDRYYVRPYGTEGNPCVVSSDVNLLTNAYTVCDMMAHPEMIRRHLTEKEKAIMRMLGAKYVTRDELDDDGAVELWSEKPELDDGGVWEEECCSQDIWIARMKSELFPSITRGMCESLGGE